MAEFSIQDRTTKRLNKAPPDDSILQSKEMTPDQVFTLLKLDKPLTKKKRGEMLHVAELVSNSKDIAKRVQHYLTRFWMRIMNIRATFFGCSS
ncbi:hypothetical protein PsorP6_011757 [Peronosclerospora sorghi]|uniref:Uncharacterized protein n=1 Tax=Peronosclerospora sorghi TaxID=230839 RepID=A0ACC0WJ65_9STRA|nr:hypothetical protein PsorP6_011757 [Peronosclerospora sorghi]